MSTTVISSLNLISPKFALVCLLNKKRAEMDDGGQKLKQKNHERKRPAENRADSSGVTDGNASIARQKISDLQAGFRLAPPTRKPSMSGCFARSPQFFSVTEPP